jgi:hypothetical protein
MILNIFSDIWTKLTELSNKCYNFIMSNYDKPFFWLIIFSILLVISYYAISNLANK